MTRKDVIEEQKKQKRKKQKRPPLISRWIKVGVLFCLWVSFFAFFLHYLKIPQEALA